MNMFVVDAMNEEKKKTKFRVRWAYHYAIFACAFEN